MARRPKAKPIITSADKAIEYIGWMALIGLWILTLYNFPSLPEIIPIHFNGSGQADGFGNKWNIMILPVVSTVIFVGLTILNNYPHVFNYPRKITDENALQQYTNTTRLLRVLKLVIVIIIGLIVIKTLQNVNGDANGWGAWFLPFTLGMIFIPLIYFLVSSLSTKKNHSQ